MAHAHKDLLLGVTVGIVGHADVPARHGHVTRIVDSQGGIVEAAVTGLHFRHWQHLKTDDYDETFWQL